MKRSEQREQNIQRVIHVAQSLFIADGIAATPISRIAEAAGLTPTSLYRYFRNKDALVFAAWRDALATFFSDFMAQYTREAASCKNGYEKFVVCMHIYFRTYDRRPEWYDYTREMFSAYSEKGTGNDVNNVFWKYYDREIPVPALKALREGVADGSIRPDAHLLKYDTSHGRFAWDVRQEREQLFVGDDAIRLLHERTIEALPWKELSVDVVLDCTGVYGSRHDGEAHIAAGAKKVLFSHPGSNDLDATVVYGVNQHELRAEHRIVSNASCTTNCIIPVIKLLDDAYGIESGTVTTIHSAMHDQQVIDAYHPDLRRTRAASQSIIPVDTKLAAGIARIFPQFGDRFEAIAVRVPTINVTAIDLSVTVKKPVKANEVNQLLQKAAQGAFHGIVDYTELPLVSTDFNHDPHSAIVDGTQTRVSGAHLIKTLVWCDNEWGFANRMLDTTLAMAAIGFRLDA